MIDLMAALKKSIGEAPVEGEGQNRCAGEPTSGVRRQKALRVAALITKQQRKALLFIEAEIGTHRWDRPVRA